MIYEETGVVIDNCSETRRQQHIPKQGHGGEAALLKKSMSVRNVLMNKCHRLVAWLNSEFELIQSKALAR